MQQTRKPLATQQPSGTSNEWQTGKWVVFSAVMASSMAFIDATALNVALPAIQSSLQATAAELLWVINSYLLVLAALILFGGSLGDKLGRKKIFSFGIIAFMIGSAACGLAPSINFLLAARVLQGLGGACMIPGSLSVISSWFSSKERGKAIGRWSAATTIVTTGGPMLGGLLADLHLWRWIFFINIPFGIASLIVLYAKVPESRDKAAGSSIDYAGALLASAGLAALTYGLIAMPAKGITNPLVYLLLMAGVIALGLFILVEHKARTPMMPPALFSVRAFAGANLLTLFLYGALTVFMFFFSLNLVQAQGYTQLQAGLSLLPFSALMILFSKAAGIWVQNHGPRLPLIVGPLLTGTGFFWVGCVGLTDGPADYWRTYFPAIIVFATGMTATVVPLTTTVMESVENHFAGTASGINNAVSRAAGVLAIALIGMIALTAYERALVNTNASLQLSPDQLVSLKLQASRLGEAAVPENIPVQKAPAVAANIKKAFLQTYSLVMFICAGCAWASAAVGAISIKGGKLLAPV